MITTTPHYTAPSQDLETRLAQERTDRVKLEREFLELQAKALSAPGAALGEVRQLREERFALQRDKALAEQKEAEVRRELSSVREQVSQGRGWVGGACSWLTVAVTRKGFEPDSHLCSTGCTIDGYRSSD